MLVWHQVLSNIPDHNMFIPSEHLKSQKYLDQINEWTINHKMKINENKSKNMIFNFSRKFPFSASLTVNGQEIETVEKARLLGTVISNDLKWDENISEIVKKANRRMVLLRKVAAFNPKVEDLKNHIYTIHQKYFRTIFSGLAF